VATSVSVYRSRTRRIASFWSSSSAAGQVPSQAFRSGNAAHSAARWLPNSCFSREIVDSFDSPRGYWHNVDSVGIIDTVNHFSLGNKGYAQLDAIRCGWLRHHPLHHLFARKCTTPCGPMEVLIGYLKIMPSRHRWAIAQPSHHHVQRKIVDQFGFP